MTREQIIEAMARAAEPLAFVKTSPLRDEGFAMLAADRALTALETAIPGLADVIEGRACIVPMPLQAVRKIACHADGPQCLGCLHYHGMAEACEFDRAMIEAGKAGET